jgi:YidC/Oxa1 family membrane protein insertase
MDADNPMASAQKMMVYMAPVFGLFGLSFPLGVLMYWVTSNSWTLAQTHYIHKRYPVAQNGNGQAAAPSKNGAKPAGAAPAPSGGLLGKLKKEPEPVAVPEPEAKPKVIRQQPVKKPRSKRSGSPKR